MKQQRYIVEYDGLDLELFFCKELLKLDSLHYGYWKPKEKLSLANLKKAQKRYTNTLIKQIPKGVKTVLDVGCGIGDVSRALVKKGYHVTCISPDKNHKQYFSKKTKNLKFIQTRFENLKCNEKFDLVVMSESQNYFPRNMGLQKCKELLEQGGYLLISGMFRKKKGGRFKGIIHNLKGDYINSARNYGLKLIDQIDITSEVLPTLSFVQKGIKEYVFPSIKMIKHFLNSTSPIKMKFLKILFSKQIREALKIYDYYIKRTNPEYFKEEVSYWRLLFKKIG